jgi:hypothetical protein
MTPHAPPRTLRWDRVLLVLVLVAAAGAGTYFLALS